jgi:hypothetical protein
MVGPVSSRWLLYVPLAQRSGSREPAEAAAPASTTASLRELQSRLTVLRRALERVQRLEEVTVRGAGSGQVASAASRSGVGLLVEDSFTTLRSMEEVNADATSFDPRGAVFGGGVSTTLPTIGGTYSGAQGDDTLTFKAKNNGTIGADTDLKIEVRDGNDDKIDELNFRDLAPDTPLTLSNGLTLSLSAGTLEKNETFEVDVFSSVGGVVDPDKPFDGTRDQHPGLKEAFSVSPGSFLVNGVSIEVFADDTIQTVVDRITASAAGVTASFEVASESVVLRQNTPGAAQTISVSADTSGFLAATKLSGAVPVIPEFTGVSSQEEINAAPTSYAPFEPSVSSPLTTAQPLITGTYSGAQGVDTLTFKLKNNGSIGADQDLKVEVRDGNDDKIDEVNFRNLAPDTPLLLSNDLKLSFAAGALKKNDTFQVDVSDLVPTSVNPDAAFSVTGDGRADFEDGLVVGAGSFDVNGVNISVAPGDTINSVLDRITALVPDVTASYDATKVRISRDTAGSFLDVVIANDTSGFVAATKLIDPASPGGQGFDADRILSTVPALSSISSGTFSINGVTLNVDVDADTLNDVIARINASAAGVSARFDQASDALVIQNVSGGGDLVLDDGTSGFFSAFQVAPGTYPSQQGEGGPRAFSSTSTLKRDLRAVRDALNDVFRRSAQGADPDVLDRVREKLGASVVDAFDKGSVGATKLRSRLGIEFDFSDFTQDVFDLNLSRLDRAASDRFEELDDFLFSENARGRGQGLVASLLDGVDGLQKGLADALGSAPTIGLIVDLKI